MKVSRIFDLVDLGLTLAPWGVDLVEVGFGSNPVASQLDFATLGCTYPSSSAKNCEQKSGWQHLHLPPLVAMAHQLSETVVHNLMRM